jgi:spectinomycin phosphotransferase
MDIHQLVERISREYAVHPLCAVSLDGGFSAAAFRVEAREGDFFLKVYDKSKAQTAQWTARIGSYMPALVHMNRDPKLRGRISEPILTAGGRYQVEDGQCVCLLFVYIHGETVGSAELTRRQAKELARTLGLVHQYRAADIPGSHLAEDFALPFCDALEAFVRNLDQCPDPDVRSAVEANLPGLKDAIRGARAAAAGSSRSKPEMVFCHTDAHNFNIMQGERLVLIDWEGMKLAPPEQDLIFAHGKPYFNDFMRVYSEYRPGFELDREMLAFYLVRRSLEDIWAFAERLTHDKLGGAERAVNLGFLRQICASLNQ